MAALWAGREKVPVEGWFSEKRLKTLLGAEKGRSAFSHLIREKNNHSFKK